jgi:hypothetical protein
MELQRARIRTATAGTAHIASPRPHSLLVFRSQLRHGIGMIGTMTSELSITRWKEPTLSRRRVTVLE